MSLNPPTQYADDRNLRARQRLWEFQVPPFDIVGWVLGLVPLEGRRVLDLGCGNGAYLHALGPAAVGCDLSLGMLRGVGGGRALVNGDAASLPFADAAFDVVLAPHMLYHVPDRAAAAREMRRVLRAHGVCVVVTNGARHMSVLRDLVEESVRLATPGWEMRNPATHVFSLENGAEQLRAGFAEVELVRPPARRPVRLTDASPAADYVASVRDHYEHQTTRSWSDVVEDVRAGVQAAIDREGEFVVFGDTGAFICR